MPLSRAWCLYEISCTKSERLFIALSRKQQSEFLRTVRHNPRTVVAALCKINLQNALPYILEDCSRIFEVVNAKEEGFAGFNNKVAALLRDWIATQARTLANNVRNQTQQKDISLLNYLDDILIAAKSFFKNKAS